MAMPYLLQVSMTCWSRMEPPGCTMAVTPERAGPLDVVAEGEEGIRAQAHAGDLAQVFLSFPRRSAGRAAR